MDTREQWVILLALASSLAAACGGGGDSAPAPPAGSPPTINGVSGTTSHGNSITISGSSFGSKSHAGPMLYDDFDDASTANIAGRVPQVHQGNLSGYNAWEQSIVGSGAPNVVRNNSGLKARSTWHARMAFTSSSYTSLELAIRDLSYFTTGAEVYVSFYYRYTADANHPRQTKAFIAYNGTDKAYFSTAFDTCEAGGWRQHRTEGGFLDNTIGLDGPEINGEWVRFENYLKQSAPNTANGAWETAVYRPTLGTPERLTDSLGNAQMRTSPDDWTEWTFGGAYWSMCPMSLETGTIDIDEFYMDSTPTRVEVCNAPTFSASTRCELQLPTAWSDTSITVTFKQGHLGAGTAYVYVVNAGGGVNAAGHPIAIP